MQASAIPATVGTPHGAGLGEPLRLRSDEQLVQLFRAGSEDAFTAIHDRYRQRLLAYARRMLPGTGDDAEDIAQEVFASAYRALRSDNRNLALRAWLYRVAHNRCIDILRRPAAAPSDLGEVGGAPLVARSVGDPSACAEQREALERLIADLQRLPDRQRAALLGRELCGMSYAELAGGLGVSVPAVKSLLVRARCALNQAQEARSTACATVRADLADARARGARSSVNSHLHLLECPSCREAQADLASSARPRGVRQRLGVLLPFAPGGAIARWLGVGGSASAGSAGAGSAAAGAGVACGGMTLGGLLGGGATHAVALLAAAAIAIGGVVGDGLVGLGSGPSAAVATGAARHDRSAADGNRTGKGGGRSLMASSADGPALAGPAMRRSPGAHACPGARRLGCTITASGPGAGGGAAGDNGLGPFYNTSMSMDAGGQSAFDNARSWGLSGSADPTTGASTTAAGSGIGSRTGGQGAGFPSAGTAAGSSSSSDAGQSACQAGAAATAATAISGSGEAAGEYAQNGDGAAGGATSGTTGAGSATSAAPGGAAGAAADGSATAGNGAGTSGDGTGSMGGGAGTTGNGAGTTGNGAGTTSNGAGTTGAGTPGAGTPGNAGPPGAGSSNAGAGSGSGTGGACGNPAVATAAGASAPSGQSVPTGTSPPTDSTSSPGTAASANAEPTTARQTGAVHTDAATTDPSTTGSDHDATSDNARLAAASPAGTHSGGGAA